MNDTCEKDARQRELLSVFSYKATSTEPDRETPERGRIFPMRSPRAEAPRNPMPHFPPRIKNFATRVIHPAHAQVCG